MGSRNLGVLLAVMVVLVPLLGDAAPVTQIHPSQFPELNIETSFPRCSSEELIASGFPDHLHAHWWNNWEVMVDEAGQTYGPGAFCKNKVLIPREGLVVEPGRNSYGRFITRQHEAYKTCDMLPLLEDLDWAERVLSEAMGLEPTDTLTVISPDNIPQYRELTGQQVWRLYQLDGDVCTIEPFGTLMARTLEAHAVFMLMTDWLLRENLPEVLPIWLHAGLVEYLGEDGPHLISYMRQFRSREPFFLPLETVSSILSQPPAEDPEKDREMFRRASYNVFLMVWELVENRGGLQAMREFLVLAHEGVDLDKASQKVYGLKMAELARSLDPAVHGEPIDPAIKNLNPSKQPLER